MNKLKEYYQTKKEDLNFFEHTSEQFDFPGIIDPTIVFIPNELYEEIKLKTIFDLKFYSLNEDGNEIFWIFDDIKNYLQKIQYRFLTRYDFSSENMISVLITEDPEIFKEMAYGEEDFWTFIENYLKKVLSMKVDIYEKHLLLINKYDKASTYIYNKETKNENPSRIHFKRVKPVNIPQTNFKRAEQFLKDAYSELKSCKVILLGLGSLGSNIALNLVKTGIRNFSLYDHDVFEPENIARHIGGVEDLGFYKVNVIKKYLLNINPESKVKTFPFNPVDGENNKKFRNQLSNADMTIVSTGSYESEMFVNEITTKRRKNKVIYCYSDEYVNQGAFLFYDPPNGPCYECLQSNMEIKPELDIITRSDRSRDVPGRSYYESPGIPGISIDVDFISLLVSKFIVTILSREISDFYERYSIFPENRYFFTWNNRGTMLNFGLQSHYIEKVSDCVFCSTEGRRTIPSGGGLKELKKKVRYYTNRKLQSEK